MVARRARRGVPPMASHTTAATTRNKSGCGECAVGALEPCWCTLARSIRVGSTAKDIYIYTQQPHHAQAWSHQRGPLGVYAVLTVEEVQQARRPLRFDPQNAGKTVTCAKNRAPLASVDSLISEVRRATIRCKTRCETHIRNYSERAYTRSFPPAGFMYKYKS